MNRQVVRYSAFASVVLAMVLGIVYFLFLGGTKAEDPGASDATAANKPTRQAAETAASRGPDALFNEPVGVWDGRDRPPVSQPFAQRDAGVVQTGYGYAEPGRLPANPNANPLRTAYNEPPDARMAPQAQLTGAAVSAASDEDAPPDHAAKSPKDPFGLRNAARGPAEARPANGAVAAARAPSEATIDQPAAGQSAVGSHYSGNPGAAAGALRTAEPTPLQAMPPYVAADEEPAAPSAGLQSVVNRSAGPAARQPVNQGQAPSQGGPAGAGNLAAQSSRTLRQNQYEPVSVGDMNDAGVEAIDAANDAASAATAGSGLSSGNAFAPAGKPAASIRALSQNPMPGASQAESLAGMAGSGRPGSRQVEGKQVPQITIEKIAPEEIQVGKPAKFELHLRNTGTVVAQGVEVHDFVPEGTQLVAANPPASASQQGELIWTLGALKPGDESTIEVELMPMVEGEVGSVAFVALRAEAGARSRVTKPDLTLQVTSAKQVMIGKEVLLTIEIANPGTGPATGVVIEERVPAGLKHAAGAELEFEVGTLKPGETRELELALTAAQAGVVLNQISARGEGNLLAQAQCELEVIAPALEVNMDGPSRRYLERQATYTVSVSNPGTAPAKDVELVTRLPKGLKFVKANNAGHYDSQTHSVVWSLAELPPTETGTVELTAVPVEPGEQRLRAEGRAKQNLADEQEQVTVVEGLAALLFEVIDVADPIEVKGETAYEIRIMNQGSKAADNVQLVATLPPELRFASADGPTRHALKGQATAGQQVIFEPLGRLAPKADTVYRIAVQGMQPGDVRMTIQVMADDLEQPITKEESTRVYSDE